MRDTESEKYAQKGFRRLILWEAQSSSLNYLIISPISWTVMAILTVASQHKVAVLN